MTVNNVNALQTYTANQQTAASNGQEAVKEGFDKLMTKLNDRLIGMQSSSDGSQIAAKDAGVEAPSNKAAAFDNSDKQAAKTDPAQSDKTQPDKTNPDKTQPDKTKDAGKQDEGKEVAKSPEDAKSEDVQSEVEKKGEELVQDIAEEMDVTQEDVEAAMEVLGLTVMELFDPDNLKQLLLNLTGSTDELSLVTNETLYGSLQNLMQTVEEDLGLLADELGISKDELNALLEQMVSVQEETGMQDIDMQETDMQGMAQQQMPEVDQEGMKDYTVSVQRDGETVQMKVTVDDVSGEKSVTEEVTDIPKAEIQQFSKNKGNGSSDMGRGAESHLAENAFLQTMERQAEVSDVQAAEPVFQSAQTEEIMDQIMEYMKINLRADTQELEMQLHPASLGTVNVQIAAKDGVLTAHFTAQNETVRAVIETQLIQLKNQFEEQGMKVDAVEVTVANHAYGEQFSEQNENMGQEQGKARKGVRRINLDEMDAEEGLEQMEDSERIAVEMMQANGNTVDYTA